MTGPQERQPWSRGDALPPDRAFFEDLFDRQEKLAVEREERLFHRLDWLSVRWALIATAIGVIVGLVWLLIKLANEH